ncbi:MAG: flippase-like domain-containing protein [Anaerolineales bacterium]|nr:flippase-like domain-containing protein [Anaerolineales bacterium]
MKSNRRTVTGVMFGVIVSAIALFVVFRWSGWQALKSSFGNVDWGLFTCSILLYLCSMSARALSWRAIMRDRFSYLQVMAALNEGYLLNNLLPWRLGEFGRAILLGQKPGMSVLGVLSSIVVERTYDILLVVVLLMAMLPAAAGIPGIEQQAVMGAVAAVVMMMSLLVAVYHQTWITKLLMWIPGDSARWIDFWTKIAEGLRVLRKGRTLAASFGWMVVSWVLAAVEYWVILRAVIPEAELSWALLMLTMTMLGVAIPSSPGYIGVFEAAGVLALSVFRVPQSDALAATLLLHGMVLVIASGLGAIALALEGETLHGLYNQVRSWIAAGRKPVAG